MRLIQKLLCALAVCAFTAAGASASPAAPKNGVEYDTLSTAQNTDAGNKVEVIEFFAYSCPHCNRFDPMLTAWVKQNADKVVFKRVHVAFHGGDVALQRMYLTMEAMGIAERYHAKVFAAIHDNNQRLSSDEEVFDWVEKNGIDRAKFIGVYRSFGAQSWVNRAQGMVNAYNIGSWPTLAVGGHYLTSPYFAGRGSPEVTAEDQQQKMALQVLDFLVAKAKAEKK